MLKQIFLFIVLFTVAILGYRNGLHIQYYADDYQRVFTNPDEAIRQAFTHANFSDHSYRPLETLSLGVIQKNWGWDTFPFRLLNLLFHAAGAFLVYHALRFWKVNTWCAVLAAIFTIISQMGAAAVLGNDTQSQITGALFSALSLWLLYRYLDSADSKNWRYFCSIFAFFLALISKETSTGLFLSITFLSYVMPVDERFTVRIKQTLLKVLPYIVCFAIYWLLRLNAGSVSPAVGNANLSIGLGINIPINFGLFFFQSILPVSSMAVMKALHYREYILLSMICIFTALFASAIGYGIVRSQRRKIILGLCPIIFCSWFPALILNHISELYAYNSLFYIGMIFGIAAEYYWLEVSKRSAIAFAGICLVILAAGITNAAGIDEKASSMKIQGDRAAIFLPQIVAYAKTMPPQERMYLIGPKDSSFEYSMFAIHGFRVSTLSDSIVRFLSHRSDVWVYAADSAESAEQAKVYPGTAFTYDSATLRIYPMKPDFMTKILK